MSQINCVRVFLPTGNEGTGIEPDQAKEGRRVKVCYAEGNAISSGHCCSGSVQGFLTHYPLFHSSNKKCNKRTRTLQRFVVTVSSVSSLMLVVGLCTQNSDADHIWHYS